MNTSLIARYLAGECKQDEKASVEEWIASDPLNKSLMDDFRQIWNVSQKNNRYYAGYFDPEQDWEQLQRRMLESSAENGHSIESSRASELQLNRRSQKSVSRYTFLLRVAAIILFASLIGVVVYQNIEQQSQEIAEPVLREIAMERAQRGNITLSDGTKVTLNAESKIILPNVFKADKREITLDGQAYFDVAHNPDRPFIIRTDNATIQVLGTSLDVRSYPQDQSVQVVVKEGRVALKANKEGMQEDAVLTAGQRGQLHLASGEITTSEVDDMDLYLSWTKGYLKFKCAPMNEVAEELERKFDIEVAFEQPNLKDLKLTAELKSRTIQNNMDVIATSLGMEYKMDQQVVTFYQLQ